MIKSNVSRRNLVTGLAVGSVGVVSAATAPAATAAVQSRSSRFYTPAPIPVRDGKAALTPDQSLELLRQGNAAFLDGQTAELDSGAVRRLELAQGQAPFVAYVSCSDSRVPPELLFGRGLGELFIIRNAGNTIDTVAMGSIEYAVAVLGVPLVVVMGHEACGAVKAAMAIVESNARFPGSIDDMLEPIIPAVLEARGAPGDKTEAAIKANVSRTVRRLRTEADPIMLEPQRAGRLKIVGAYYSLSTGGVEFFDV